MIYATVNVAVLENIPIAAKRILDIGCGAGDLGKALKNRSDCEVVGITYSEAEAELASAYLDKVLVGDLNNSNLLDNSLGVFDCVVCSHILEHLYFPEDLLKVIPKILKPKAKLVIALPNVLNWKQRAEFLKGNFRYTEGGTMDRTHFRFFDWNTAFELLQTSSYQILVRQADGYFPLPFIRTMLGSVALKMDMIASKAMPALFATQFILVAQFRE